MFGLDGTTLLGNILAHRMVHKKNNPDAIYKKQDLESTVKTVLRFSPHIAGICEVLEGQEAKLWNHLKKSGFESVHFGDGYKTEQSGLVVKTAIATKVASKKYKLEDFPVENKIGGGGGLVVARITEPDTDIVCVHMAHPENKVLYIEQTNYILNLTNRFQDNIIIAGDFNQTYEKIRSHFLDLQLATKGIKTSSTTPVLKWFKNEDLDHILFRGFELKKSGSIQGKSDHKLVYAEFR
jgi:endonuclease/exonuclease/phosphatase family metal-dependent hydrolase